MTPGYKQAQVELGRPAPEKAAALEFEDPYAVKEAPGRRGVRAAGAGADGKRQEKQVATASRLIAGALGVRAPKRTEEQRAYDRAVREREQKRLDEERAERAERRRVEAEKEKAKASVWED